MLLRFSLQARAKLAVVLTCLVMLGCVIQKAGFSVSCPQQTHASASLQDDQFHSTAESGCKLTEQMMNSSFTDDMSIFPFIVLSVFIGWLLTASVVWLPRANESPPRRRIHLSLCVFRE